MIGSRKDAKTQRDKKNDLSQIFMDMNVSGGNNLPEPSQLSATGLPHGVNRLDFCVDEGPDGIIYEIWRRHGDTVDWAVHATTTNTTYTDSPVEAGQYYEYKVRSVLADSM